uniref:Putative anion transporter 3, chloroplastic n=1 Tax=Schizaphis graminum TaxID=13262 RepID=A0A2S2PG89_SCHGA
MWGNVMTAVLVLPVCLMVDKYGLKEILSYSCCFFTLGTAVRCMPIMYSCTLCLHLSAVCLSVGSVVTTPLIITMSRQWFPKKERNMAIGLCSAVSTLGSAATYIIGPMMVSTASDGPLSRSGFKRVSYSYGLSIVSEIHYAAELQRVYVVGRVAP